MSSWNKVKGLFWQSRTGSPEPGELSDSDLAELLSSASPQDAASVELAPEAAAALDSGAAQIDFQAQYDLAAIPNTDEVEQLEGFLARLDDSLPLSSKLGAAQAFLGAIGKSKEDVLRDAGRKLQYVRAIAAHRAEQTEHALRREQDSIQALQAQIDEHRTQMETLSRELEAVRVACRAEEARLQAARVFFGAALGNGEPSPAAP